jgi:peptidoglycan/LPS O-acetylase OafA/YrhL
VLIFNKIIFNCTEINLFNSVFSFSIDSFGILLLLPLLSEFKKGSGLLFKLITTISLISYSMYLINYTIMNEYVLSMSFFQNNIHNGVSFTCYLMLVFIGSIFMYNFIEKPFMNLRESKFFRFN